MLLPFLGFVTGCLFFGIVGTILIKTISYFHFTFMNLLIFLTGALPSAFIVSAVYGWYVAGPDGLLENTSSVLGLFFVTLFGGVIGGLSLLYSRAKLTDDN